MLRGCWNDEEGEKTCILHAAFYRFNFAHHLDYAALTILHFRENIAVLFPKGIIALKERNLLFIIQALMLLVIIPVYILTFIFSWKYQCQ